VPAESTCTWFSTTTPTHKTPESEVLARHPRSICHFTPTGSSWINQVERWFGLLTGQRLIRRRRAHLRPSPGEGHHAWIQTWNETRGPHLDQDRREILQSARRTTHKDHPASNRNMTPILDHYLRRRTLVQRVASLFPVGGDAL